MGPKQVGGQQEKGTFMGNNRAWDRNVGWERRDGIWDGLGVSWMMRLEWDGF